MILLIADSGSTKTDWALVDTSVSTPRTFCTGGINPVLLDDGQIRNLLQTDLVPRLCGEKVDAVFFYGAGCRPEQQPRMARLLRHALSPREVQVEGDLLGACRALCAAEEGICCILGTGSASCLYDGHRIARQTPSLGYIIGDEGSGCALGRRLLSDMLKGLCSQPLQQAFFSQTGLTVALAIDRIYSQPWPNRFMASLAPFVARHIDAPEMHDLAVDEFRRFIRRNLLAYARPQLPVHFVGSIAHHFAPQLREALRAEGLVMGRIEQRPLPSLVNYHLNAAAL